MTEITKTQLDELLTAVGELLESQNVPVQILIVGGASLCLAGWIPPRPTEDVDVLARVDETFGKSVLESPDTLPEAFGAAVRRVARDFGMPEDWINTEVAMQWHSSLPPSATEGIQWRRYGALHVGLAGRQTMISLKLFAAVDQGKDSVHYQDLLTLAPSNAELEAA
ncbi:MAG: hypothetical protein ACE5HV_16310, partial [Acidobacteriota bacterium]